MDPIMSKPKYTAREIQNLKDMLEQTVALHSDKEAFIKKAKDVYVGVTYKKYKEDIFALGTELLNLGIKDERVLLVSEARYECAVAFMATVCGGGVIVPIFSTKDKLDELVSKINSVKAKFIIFSEKYRDSIRFIRKRCPTLKVLIDMDTIIDSDNEHSLLNLIDIGNKHIINGDNTYAKLEIEKEKSAGIFFSQKNSNSVTISHKNFVSNIMAVTSVIDFSNKDKTINLFPIDNIFGCSYNFLLMNYLGATICFGEENKELSELLKDNKPTLLVLNLDSFNKFYEMLWQNIGNMPKVRKIKLLMFISELLRKFNIDLRHKLFSDVIKSCGEELKNIIVCCEKIELSKVRCLNSFGINVFYGYGMVETSGLITLNELNSQKERSIGLPLPELQVSINKPNERGVGELIVRGEMVTCGYFDNTKLTSKTIINGWLFTGELAYRDKNGYFAIIGKKKKNKEVEKC